MPEILLYETESPATMVRAERQIRQLFGMKANEVAGYRFSMNTRSGHWIFTGPAGMVPGQQATVNDEGKARSVADGIFEQMNARASRSQGLPRLFQTDVLKFATAMPHISPSTRELVAWDVNYRMELRPSRDEEPVPVEELGIHLRISTQGILQQLHYNLLPIKTEQKTQRLQVGNALAQGSAETEETDPAIVYRPAPGKVVPYYLYAHRTDGGDLALYYPACTESPEVPRAVPAVAKKEPDKQALPLDGNMTFCMYLVPHEAFASSANASPENLKLLADRIIENITAVWDGLTYVAPDGTQTQLCVTISYVEGEFEENEDSGCDMIITIDDPDGIPDPVPTRENRRGYRSHACLGYFEGYFTLGSINDTERNMPAHEFGHMLGLADRYHYYQVFKNDRLREIDGQDPINEVTTSDCIAASLPMILPGSHDSQYDFRDNLMANTRKKCITNRQLEIILKKELEVLPVHQFTYLGVRSFEDFENTYPKPGIGLFVTNEDGSFKIAKRDDLTSKNKHVFVEVSSGEELYSGPNNFNDRLTRNPKPQNGNYSTIVNSGSIQQAFINPILEYKNTFLIISNEKFTINVPKLVVNNENDMLNYLLSPYFP